MVCHQGCLLVLGYGGTKNRKRRLYTSSASRVPLLPDTASLEEVAKTVGRAAAESIPGDEAASDPPSASSSSSSSSDGRPGGDGVNEGVGAQGGDQRPQQVQMPLPSSTPAAMDVSSSQDKPSRPSTSEDVSSPKRLRLRPDRPGGSGGLPGIPSSVLTQFWTLSSWLRRCTSSAWRCTFK